MFLRLHYHFFSFDLFLYCNFTILGCLKPLDCEATLSAGYWAAAWWDIWCCSWYLCFSVRNWYVSRFRFMSNLHWKSSLMVSMHFRNHVWIGVIRDLEKKHTDSRFDLRFDNLACVLHSENVGLLGLTHVGSRRVVQISTAFMIFFSIFGLLSCHHCNQFDLKCVIWAHDEMLKFPNFQESLAPSSQWYLCQYLLPCTVSYGALSVSVRNLMSFIFTNPLYRL